jgi:hypothetical protein
MFRDPFNGLPESCFAGAGTIASKEYGVAKKARVIAVKVLKSNGSGTMSDVIGGVDWAARYDWFFALLYLPLTPLRSLNALMITVHDIERQRRRLRKSVSRSSEVVFAPHSRAAQQIFPWAAENLPPSTKPSTQLSTVVSMSRSLPVMITRMPATTPLLVLRKPSPLVPALCRISARTSATLASASMSSPLASTS